MRPNRISPAPVLLGFLFEYPNHGYDLHQRLTHDFGSIWHVSQSQTYSILKRLENQGYIASTLIYQEKLPPRQLLQLTEQGCQWFDTWLNQPTKCSVHSIRVEFITRLHFILRYYPEKTEQIIESQVEEVRLGMSRLMIEQLNISSDQRVNCLALDLRIKLLNSIITWLEECRVEFGLVH